MYKIEIRYAPGGDENFNQVLISTLTYIEIRYAPGGDENSLVSSANCKQLLLRLDMPREGTKTVDHALIGGLAVSLRLDMPREGTKTRNMMTITTFSLIEIRYAPGGDENLPKMRNTALITRLRLDMPREGTKTDFLNLIIYILH